MGSLLTGVFATAMMLAAGLTQASPITSAGDPALAGGTVVTFTGTPDGLYPSLTIGSLTILGGATVDSGGACVYSIYPVPCIINWSGTSLTFNLASSVSAFGLQIGAVNYASSLTAYNSLNQVIESVTVPDQVGTQAYPYTGFWGINAGSSIIDHVTMQAVSGDIWVIDNVSFSGSAAVPEPGSLALLGLALAGLGFSRRRSEKQAS